MKKNLISILVLGLVVANLVVSVLTLTTISTASTKVTTLITDISSVLALELTDDSVTLEPAGLTAEDIAVFNLSNEMTISLKSSPEDTKQNIAVIQVSLLMDTTNPDYAKYKDTLLDKEAIFQTAVTEIVSSHTADELNADQAAVREEILRRIQTDFGSTFIYQVNFTSFLITKM